MLSRTTNNIWLRIANTFATLRRAQLDWDKVERSLQEVALLGQRVVAEYPFLPIPQAVIDNYPLDTPQAITLVAFRTLTNTPPATFNSAYSLLLPEKHQYQPVEPTLQTRRQIFTDYFETKLPELIATINGEKGLEEKSAALSVFNQLSLSHTAKESVLAIDINKIKEESGLLIAIYLQLLLKLRLPHQTVLPQLAARLGQGSSRLQIQTARSLFTLPNYSRLLPADLLDKALIILSKHLPLMQDDQTLVLLRLVYDYTSPASKQFAAALRDKLKQPGSSAIALILKTMKYCEVLRIEHESLLIVGVKKGMGRFFNTLMFLWLKGNLSAEAEQLLVAHIASTLKEYCTSEDLTDEELIRFIKLAARHMWILPVDLQTELKQSLLLKILPKYPKEMDLLYECLMLLLQLPRKNQQTEAESQQLFKSVQMYIKCYLDWSCQRNNSGQLRLKEKAIDTVQLLHLILVRNMPIPHSDLPLIASYPFQIQEVQQSSQLQSILTCLLSSQESSESLKTALNNLLPIADHQIKKRRLSFRGTLQLLSLTLKAGYQQQPFFRKIERSIFEMLQKFPQFTISNSDLHLLKDTLLKRRLSSRPFEQFIQNVLAQPSKWEELRSQYVKNQRQFQSKRKIPSKK